jgi:hypothetical protein
MDDILSGAGMQSGDEGLPERNRDPEILAEAQPPICMKLIRFP